MAIIACRLVPARKRIFDRETVILGEEAFGMDQYEAVVSMLRQYEVPIVMDVDIGHLPPMLPIISGGKASVTVADGALDIQYKF